GFFGPPVSELWRDTKELRFADERVERIWLALEEQVAQLLTKRADEVEALVENLLEKRELANPEILELLGKNSLQTSREAGEELESVLTLVGTSEQGLEFRRKASRKAAKLADGELPTAAKGAAAD
ncbi:MAG: hypothetical protein DWI61_02145, partial [Chloroflexi bacterium]